MASATLPLRGYFSWEKATGEGRQRPATVFYPRHRAVTLEGLQELHSSTTKHSNVSEEFGKRSAGGTAESSDDEFTASAFLHSIHKF